MAVKRKELHSPNKTKSAGAPSVQRSERTATSAAEGRSLEVAWSILDTILGGSWHHQQQHLSSYFCYALFPVILANVNS